MQNITPFVVFLLLISPCVGSFLAVLADRLPRGEDVVRQPSACRSCGAALSPRDLVPVLSFVRTRGRCRHCAATIPPWTLYAEILATGAAVLALLAGGGMAQVLLSALVLWCLTGLAITDMVWMRLPDPLTLTLAAGAFGLAALPGGMGLFAAFMGAVSGAGSFALIRWGYAWVRGREGLGAGDVKLMVGLGALSGPWDLPLLVLLGAVGGLAIAAARRNADRAQALPFGAALCAAGAVIWLMSVN